MIRAVRGSEPVCPGDPLGQARQRILEAVRNFPATGRRTGRGSAYRNSCVRQRLQCASRMKCSWCEADLRAVSASIDHVRPYGRYWWLAATWQNLLAVCEACTSAKGDEFPLDDGDNTVVHLPVGMDIPGSEVGLTGRGWGVIDVGDGAEPNPAAVFVFSADLATLRASIRVDGSVVDPHLLWRAGATLATLKLNVRHEMQERYRLHLRWTIQPLLEALHVVNSQREADRRWKQITSRCLASEPFSLLSWSILSSVEIEDLRFRWNLLLPPRP